MRFRTAELAMYLWISYTDTRTKANNRRLSCSSAYTIGLFFEQQNISQLQLKADGIATLRLIDVNEKCIHLTDTILNLFQGLVEGFLITST